MGRHFGILTYRHTGLESLSATKDAVDTLLVKRGVKGSGYPDKDVVGMTDSPIRVRVHGCSDVGNQPLSSESSELEERTR